MKYYISMLLFLSSCKKEVLNYCGINTPPFIDVNIPIHFPDVKNVEEWELLTYKNHAVFTYEIKDKQ